MMTENNFQIDSAAVTDKGLSEKRPQNEDSYLEMNERGLFVIADGVGGAQAGDVASQMATEILGEAFTNFPKNGDAEEVMKLAIEQANQSIFQMSHDLPQLSTMATTIVALHISGNIATIGHVGDSRLYRLDTNGNLYRETQDHSMVEEEMRAGRLTASQAANHPNKNIISRALGADSTVEVDMKTIMFDPRTTFFLCSDGITRHVEDTELRDILQSNESPSSVVQKLKKICFERGAEDNLTAVVAKVTDQVIDRSIRGANGNSAIDSDESTIATARSPLSDVDEKTKPSIFENSREIPTQPLKMPPVEAIHTAEIANVTEASTVAPVVETNTLSSAGTDFKNKAETVISKKTEIKTNPQPTRAVEKSGSAFGKFISSLLLLLLGGAVGAGAYYLWAQNHREPVRETAITQPTPQSTPTSAIPYAIFEASRRAVDRNPQSYLDTNAAPPEKAEDFYLLGRANLLTGKYAEAKKSFEEAKNRLGQADESNSKILANEIAMSLAIINDPFAQRAFEKDAMNQQNAGAPANTNLNANQTNTNPNLQTNQNNSNRQTF